MLYPEQDFLCILQQRYFIYFLKMANTLLDNAGLPKEAVLIPYLLLLLVCCLDQAYL